MSCSPHSHSKTQAATLMNLAAALADFTGSAESCARIPAFLAGALSIECLSLTLIRDAADDAEPSILFCGSSGKLADDDAAFRRQLLHIYRQTTARTTDLSGPREGMLPSQETCAELHLPQFTEFPRARIFAHAVDACHRVVLIVHLRPTGPELNTHLAEDLLLIARHLATPLRCLLSCQASPDALGEPFSQLTDREWMVLRSLNSDIGEKQLADSLGLSPHTLHSHIKSIYRKIGVQGRIALLLRFKAAVARMRIDALSLKPAPNAVVNDVPLAVAS